MLWRRLGAGGQAAGYANFIALAFTILFILLTSFSLFILLLSYLFPLSLGACGSY